jgi:hypothetical protein
MASTQVAKVQTFRGLPSSLFQYAQAVFSSKPLLAPSYCEPPNLQVTAQQVRINVAHVRRYCDVCGITPGESVPAAYLHILAMPLHMRLFTHDDFPARVLGLVHLRNTIRQWRPIRVNNVVELSTQYNTLRCDYHCIH